MIRAPWRVGELSGIAIRLLLGYDVFISYRWQPEVQSVVRDLAARLEALGINCFTDEREIEGGEKLPSAIKRGIRRSRIFIIFVSDSIQSSDWMPKELDCACIARRVILPVDIDDAVARLSSSAAWKSEHPKWERWSVLETQKVLKVPTLSLSEAEVADLAGRVLAIIGRRTTRVRAIRWAFSIAMTVAVVVAVSSVWAISESVRAVRITRDAQAETSRLQELGQLTNRRLAKSQGALVEVNKQKESADEARKAADRSRDASNKLADEASRRSKEAEKQAKLSLRRATDLWDRRATVAELDMAPAQVEFFLAKEVELDRSLLKVALPRYRAALARQSLVPEAQLLPLDPVRKPPNPPLMSESGPTCTLVSTKDGPGLAQGDLRGLVVRSFEGKRTFAVPNSPIFNDRYYSSWGNTVVWRVDFDLYSARLDDPTCTVRHALGEFRAGGFRIDPDGTVLLLGSRWEGDLGAVKSVDVVAERYRLPDLTPISPRVRLGVTKRITLRNGKSGGWDTAVTDQRGIPSGALTVSVVQGKFELKEWPTAISGSPRSTSVSWPANLPEVSSIDGLQSSPSARHLLLTVEHQENGNSRTSLVGLETDPNAPRADGIRAQPFSTDLDSNSNIQVLEAADRTYIIGTLKPLGQSFGQLGSPLQRLLLRPWDSREDRPEFVLTDSALDWHVVHCTTSDAHVILAVLERNAVSIFDRRSLLARYPVSVTNPQRLLVSSDSRFLAVVGDKAVQVWRCVDRGTENPQDIPSSGSLAHALNLDSDGNAYPPSISGASVGKPAFGSL